MTRTPTTTDRSLARRVLQTEAAAITALIDRLDENFDRAVRMLFECQGRVIVTGMGKSGIICRKIAATLASTGTSAFFLHPAEATHGDLGVIQPNDVLLAISHSGETQEVLRLLEAIRRIGARIIAITGNPASTLAQAADVALDCQVSEEACPLNLVPTASTTAALAMGDALCMTLLVEKGFREEDFAKIHPGGKLGKKLMRVDQLMHGGRRRADRHHGHADARRHLRDVEQSPRHDLRRRRQAQPGGHHHGRRPPALHGRQPAAARDDGRRCHDQAPHRDRSLDARRTGAAHHGAAENHLARRRRPRPDGRGCHSPARPLANRAVLSAYYPFLAALIALLLGLTVGKAWERYKLRSGRLIDRRRVPESLHYIVGLNFLVTNQIDLAIEELNKAAENLGDALEIHLLLGSLYREKGQVARAINIHQSLLQRPRLTRLEHAHVLLCLGLDFKRGGFVDRALEAFNEVIKLDPKNQYALLNIEKLHEDQHQWQEAYEVRRSIGSQAGAEDGRSQAILAFLENEMGLQAVARGDYPAAIARFQSAIDLDAGVVPAYLNLGDIYAREDKMAQAASVWEQVIDQAPERAYLTFDRLSLAYEKLGTPERFSQLCRQADPRAIRRTGARASRWPDILETRTTRPARSSCCSKRLCTIRMR